MHAADIADDNTKTPVTVFTEVNEGKGRATIPLISMASPSCCTGRSPFLLLNFMKSLVLSVQAGIAVYFESSESISAPILTGKTGK